MTEQPTPRPLAAVESNIASTKADRAALHQQYEAAIASVGANYSGDTTQDVATAQRLHVMLDGLDSRLRSLEIERYAALKADVLKGYRAALEAQRAASQASKEARLAALALENELNARLKEAHSAAHRAQQHAFAAKDAADRYVQQRAAASGDGDRLQSDLAPQVRDVMREFNPSIAKADQRLAELKQQRETERVQVFAQRYGEQVPPAPVLKTRRAALPDGD